MEQEKLRQKLTSKSDFLARRGAAWLLIERVGMETAAISTSIQYCRPLAVGLEADLYNDVEQGDSKKTGEIKRCQMIKQSWLKKSLACFADTNLHPGLVASSPFWISFACKESATHSASCPNLHLTAPAESLTKAIRADARKEARLSGNGLKHRRGRHTIVSNPFRPLKCNLSNREDLFFSLNWEVFVRQDFLF